jgi:hypothetical protein
MSPVLRPAASTPQFLVGAAAECVLYAAHRGHQDRSELRVACALATAGRSAVASALRYLCGSTVIRSPPNSAMNTSACAGLAKQKRTKSAGGSRRKSACVLYGIDRVSQKLVHGHQSRDEARLLQHSIMVFRQYGN